MTDRVRDAVAVEPLRLERASETDEAGPRVHLLADLLTRPELLEPPRAIVPRLAYQGRITLLSAPKKSGKSTLIGAAAAALSAGESFLGLPTDPGAVLWGCFDEPLGDLVRRLMVGPAKGHRIYIAERCSTVEFIAEANRPDREGYLPVSLVVVDTLGDLFAREVENENDSSQVRRALAPLRTFARDSGAAVVLLHHTAKGSGRARGAGAFEEVADVVLTLSRSEDDATVRKVAAEGRAGVEDYEFRLGPSGVDLVDAEPTSMSQVEAAIWGHPGSSTRAVERLVKMRAEIVRSSIGILVRLGRIRDVGTPSNHQWVVVERGRTPDAPSQITLDPSGDAAGRTRDALPEAGSASSPVGGRTPRDAPNQRRADYSPLRN